ncbi:hypothetical protein BS47DRAFT_1346128 [Hydnum rufescens UP504]|uniref:PLAC8-domain-containing protein n=1 Tax=Hydnum rufescens UP504 TaxID=1448309 RepID=A0A9P6AU31_9AGAM|nr:hypothetical protein BS47DRAFT_1346128 [Hydnum rufescens UP504]
MAPQMVMVVQPGLTQGMTTYPLVGGNLNSFNKPFSYNGHRDWSYGGCSCLSAPGTCLCACCFPCCTYAKTQSRVNHLMHQGIPHPSHGDSCTGDCCSYGILLFLGCPCFLGMGGRKNIRHRYHIDGGCCSDFFCTWCCVPCSLTQESREVSLEEHSFRR